jgi:hypothetical protein
MDGAIMIKEDYSFEEGSYEYKEPSWRNARRVSVERDDLGVFSVRFRGSNDLTPLSEIPDFVTMKAIR